MLCQELASIFQLRREKMEQQPDPSARGTFLSLLLALMFGGGFLIFLIIVSGFFFFYVLLAVLCIALVGFLHYILWGQALTDEVAMERAVAEENARREEEEHIFRKHDGIRRL
jgi:fatty acid desaturase